MEKDVPVKQHTIHTLYAIAKALAKGLEDGTFGKELNISYSCVNGAFVNMLKVFKGPSDLDAKTLIGS